jgi:tetratricopeptide (TPR) repeat protein
LESAGGELSAIYRALASVEKKRGDHEASAGHYRSILALEPDDRVARSALLNALFEAGDVDEVRSQIEVWLATDPSQVDLRVRLAEVHSRQGRLEDATIELARAVDLDPDTAGLRYLLGQTLGRQGKVGEATRQFEAAVRLAPDHEAANLALAVVSVGEGETEKAVGYYSRVLEIDSRNSEALLGLARLYVVSGRAVRALPYLETLVRTAPENALAHHELGVALLRIGRLSEGVEHVRRAYALDELFFEAANNVAWVLSSRPEPDLRDGAGALLIARELNAKTGYRELAYLETLAAAFAETGDFDAAVRTTETAIGIAHQTGESRAAEGLIDRLELYRRGRPVRVPDR